MQQLRETLASENRLELGSDTEGKVWRLAYEWGHSSGENEIRYYYEELTDIVVATIRDLYSKVIK